MTAITTADVGETLRSLLSSFDVRVADLTRDQRAILAMAQRGIDIYREIAAVADVAPNVSLSGLRSLVDLAILVRWIEPCQRRATVLPTTRDRTESIDDLSEAGFIFQILSQPSHSSGRAYVNDEFIRRLDGIHYSSNPAFDGSAIKSLAVPSICLLLASARRQLDLGTNAESDAIRMEIAGWPGPGASGSKE